MNSKKLFSASFSKLVADALQWVADLPTCFQAARLTRFVDRPQKKGSKAKEDEIETESLICSRYPSDFSAQQMFTASRRYWGIENGLHLRLDVTAEEDRSRVRTPRSAFNLAMIRGATISLAVHWIQRCPNKRQATLQGFYDFMTAKNARRAFSLVTASKPPWLAK